METEDQADSLEVDALTLLTDLNPFQAAFKLKGLLETGDAVETAFNLADQVEMRSPERIDDFRTLLRDALSLVNIQTALRDKLMACCEATQDNLSETLLNCYQKPINDPTRKLRAQKLRDANKAHAQKPYGPETPPNRAANDNKNFPNLNRQARMTATRNTGHTGKR